MTTSHPLERHHPVGDHLVELGHDRLDSLRPVCDLDHDREVLREPQDARGVQVRVRAEPLDPPQDRRAGHPFLSEHLDDRLVERLPAVLVGLADEDSQQLALALELHSVLPIARPANAASMPSATIPTEFTRARPTAPSSASLTLSYA